MENLISLPNSEYSIGWICALPLEMTAARAMLDGEHAKPADQNPNDCNSYCLGHLGPYNVVIACLPAGAYGVTSAAVVGTQMLQTFQCLKFGLMVGIGGGAPSEDADVRLGDVVVSKPGRSSGGVIQFDFGKEYGNGLFQRVGSLNRPPGALLTTLAFLETEHLMKGNRIPDLLDSAYSRFPNLVPVFSHQGQENDLLFTADYDHNETASSCQKCDQSRLSPRSPRTDTHPVVFQGLIASGNQVMKHGATRERLGRELGVICFEMEAAGLMNILPCLVIRGICDYADSHKNKRWQPYAAMTAAAFASELLHALPMQQRELAIQTVEIAQKTDEWESRLELSLSSVEPADVLQIFNTVAREIYTPKAPIVSSDPTLYWVLKNIDYQIWNQMETRNSILCLSAPEHDNLNRVVSCIKDTDGSKMNAIVLTFAWTDLFNTLSPLTTFIQTAFSVLLESLPVDEAKTALLRFLRAVRDNLSSSDRGKLDKYRFPSKTKESFLQMVHAMLSLGSANSCLAFMDALMHQTKNFLVVVNGDKTWDSSLLTFTRRLRKEMQRFGEGASQFKLLVTGKTNTAMQGSWTRVLHIQFDQERQDCLSTLSFDNTRYNKIIDHHADSLEWLWAHSQYREWSAATTPRLLYLEGKPGSGKSTLTKYFREHILDKIAFQNKPVIADFFYSHRDGERETRHRNMFQSLLWDILNQDSTLFYHFQLEYRSIRARSSPMTADWNYESLQKIFLSIADHPNPKEIYLILDALDESEDCDRRDVVRFLLTLCGRSGPCIFRIFIASRPTTVIRVHMRRAQNCNLIVMQDETETDIRTLARSFLGPELNFSGKLLQDATNYVVETAQGVFLWVQLIRAELQLCVEKGYRKKEIFKMLLELPTELETFYLHMLDTLNNRSEKDVEDGRSMFQLALFAERSLTVTEIQHVLAMEAILAEGLDITEESFEDELIQAMETRIIHCGGNFLEIKGDKSVQLIHQTVREFFQPRNTSHHGTGTVARSRFILDQEAEIHARMVRVGIHYLQIVAIDDWAGLVPWEEEAYDRYAEHLNNRPLLRYILQFLSGHMSKSCKSLDVEALIMKAIPTLHENSISYLLATWLDRHLHQKVPALRRIMDMSNLKLRLLHAAARKDLVEAAELVFLTDIYVDSFLDGKTAFHVAVTHGSHRMIQFLLNQHAGIAKTSDLGRNVLHCAAEQGDFETVKLLIPHCNTDVKDVNGLTPLHLAAQNGHLAVVKLLAAEGGNIYVTDKAEHWAPLHWASHSGHVPMIRYLMDQYDARHEAPLDSETKPELLPDRKGRTLIHLAAANNQPESVQLLLHSGASPSRRDKDSFTALMAAAATGHERVVQLLVGWRRELCLEMDDGGRTSLSLGALRGHIEVVRALAEPQGDLGLRDNHGQSALHLATTANSIPIINLLIALGGNVDARDDFGSTSLHIAAYHDNLDALNTLAELGADVRAVDTDGRDALYLTAGRGHVQIVEALLRLGSDPNSKDWRGWTPLFWAAGNGHDAVISLLIQHSADVNAKDENGVTSLHWAARKGQLSSVQLLLRHGADPHAVDTNEMNGRHWATEFKHPDIAQLLLSHGGSDDDRMDCDVVVNIWTEYDKIMPGVL